MSVYMPLSEERNLKFGSHLGQLGFSAGVGQILHCCIYVWRLFAVGAISVLPVLIRDPVSIHGYAEMSPFVLQKGWSS